ncbi:restriction endonuclease subunit S, partial [Mycobacterium kansasii]
GHYICFAPRHQEDPRYLNWLFRSPPYTYAYALLSRGVRIGQVEIDNDGYRLLPVLLPPVAEQRAIADYLDRETARIDRLIE